MSPKEKKYSRFFTDKDFTSHLKESSLNSGIWIMVGQIGGHVLRTLSIIILARLLTPEDYGLIAMVAVLINFIQMFKDIGLNVATIQSPEINHAQISNLFWYNTAICLLLGIIVAACAPLVAWFYSREELLNITLCLAVTFPISGLIIQHIALLQRQLNYRDIAIIQILSVVISVTCTIISAYSGLGYWSLVIMELSGVVSTTLLAFCFCPWVPSLPNRQTRTAHFLRFGGYLTASNFCEYLSNNLDKLIIGKVLNPGILGQYTKAFDLSLLPLRKISFPLNNLGVSTLSRLQDDPARYRHYYTFAQETMVLALVPFFALGFACSESLFNLFLGDQWHTAAPIFSWFCLISLATTCTCTTRWLFISQGRAKEFLYITLISAIISIISFIIGIHYGIMGITLCYTATTILLRTPLLLILSSHKSPVRVRDQLNSFLPTILISAIIVIILRLSLYFSQITSDIGTIALALSTYLFCFVAAFILSRSWRRRLSRLATILLEKLKIPVPSLFQE